MASIDSFTIRVKGRGCHGSSPADGVDPIVIAAQIVLALQTLVSREIRGTDSAVLTIGAIHGGQVYNIIPDAVEMIGAVRCLDENIRLFFEKRIREVCTGIAQIMRGDCTVEYHFGFPVTVNHPDVTTFAMECAKSLFSADCVQKLKNPLMGSEDMAYFLNRCKGCYWVFSTAPDGETPQPNHSAYFSIDDSNLYKGSALLAAAAMEWLEKQSD
jgi:amidohydrolase